MASDRIIRRASSTGTTSVPSDIIDRAARRLGTLALLVGLAHLAALLGFLRIGRPIEPSLAIQIVQGVIAALSLGLATLCRSARFRRPWLLDLGLVYAVVVAFAIAAAELMMMRDSGPAARGLSWVALWITAFTILVPSAYFKSALAIVAAGAANVSVLAIAVAAGATSEPPRGLWMAQILPNAIAVVIALGIARVVHGLARDVKKARRLGSYTLEEKLGAGGMGEVWRASHKLLARPAAVKLIRQGDTDADARRSLLARFEREAQATAALESPHTVKLFDFGVTGAGDLYYAMELIDGVDLEDLVCDGGPQDPPLVAELLGQVCHSLADAHAAGLIHRDIKPSNIMITENRLGETVAKVLDFGLVSPLPTDVTTTAAGKVVGTPAFMAPEMIRGDNPDHRIDIYALGCVGYWLLAGALPFEAANPIEVISRHLDETPVAPSARAGRELPAALEGLVLECLAKDPADRPQTAAVIADRLDALAHRGARAA